MSQSPAKLPESPLREILDLARWAPSGDNTQPWRFEPLSDRRVRIHGFDTRDHCVYDLDGRPSRLSIGALLETLSIAASLHGLRAEVLRVPGQPETAPLFDVQLLPVAGLAADPLAPLIRERSVQRRPLSTRPLTAQEREALEAAAGSEHEILWFDSAGQRRAMAWLLFRSAQIRLTIEEAYRVHASIIEWRARTSEDRVPDAALGLDAASLTAMRWVMGSWPRMRFVARYLGGTLAPRVQLDLLPGLRCAGHFVIASRAARPSGEAGLDADFAAGRVVQRVWLTAERLGLRHQPEMTPLIFSRYAAEGVRFSADAAARRNAGEVCRRFDALLGPGARERAVWMGRIGAGPRPQARSVRRPLEALLVGSGVNPAS